MYTKLMVLMFHILTAFGSIIVAGAAYFGPTHARLRTAYALTITMLLSGTYLVLHNRAHLLQGCVMGLIFLSIVSVELVAARRKLARETVSVQQ